MVQTADLQGDTLKSYLTLSAVPDDHQALDRTAAAIERELDAIDAARRARRWAEAAALEDGLIAFVFGPDAVSGGPAGVVSEAELELRGLWGDR